MERVLKPPPTCSTSSEFNSRAPRRINTLSCSFMLSSCVRHFQSIGYDFLPGRRIEAARLELALRRSISVPAAKVRVPGAGRLGIQTPADFLGLFPVQFTSAPPNQDSAFIVHVCSPFSSIWDR